MNCYLLASNPLFGLSPDGRGFYFFSLEIYFYGVFIMTGVLVATILSALLMKRRNISPDLIFVLFLCCIPTALICARLFYCITDGMPIGDWFRWSSIRRGGLSVIGGVIGGVAMGYLVCRLKKIEFLRAADCVVVTILIAQAIGRWGNFINEEVYGPEVTNEALQWFPVAVQVGTRWYLAFFFYEGCINTIGFIILYTLAWKYAYKPNGLFTFAYFLWYGTVRSIMEPLRNESFILSGGGVPWSLVFSIGMAVFGLCGIIVLLLLNYKKEGKLIGSEKGDPCGITAYIPAAKDDKPYYSKINMLGANYPPMPEEERSALSRRWEAFWAARRKKRTAEEPGEAAHDVSKADAESAAHDDSTAPHEGNDGGEQK